MKEHRSKSHSQRQHPSGSKSDRKNHSAQSRRQHRAEIMQQKRIGSSGGPPKVVGIISFGSLNPTAIRSQIVQPFLSDAGKSDPTAAGKSLSAAALPLGMPVSVESKQWRLKACVVAAAASNVQAVLDLAKVVDILVYVVPLAGLAAESDPTMAEMGTVLPLIRAQGVPAAIGCYVSPPGHVATALATKVHKESVLLASKIFREALYEDVRIAPLDSEEDVSQLYRWLSIAKLRPIHWRDEMPYLLIDSALQDPSFPSVVAVTGTVRGRPLSADQLIHISHVGTFQIEKITDGNVADFSSPSSMLAVPSAVGQESLQSSNVPDPLANDQTWPTEEELKEQHDNEKKRLQTMAKGTKVRKHVPRGFSDYQAAWIVDDDVEEVDEDEDDEDGKDCEMDDKDEETDDGEGEGDEADDMDMEDVESKDGDETAGMRDGIDNSESSDESESSETGVGEADTRDGAAAEAKQRMLEEMQHHRFPDEVDTPTDQPARVRFARYRGLKSFNHSAWDPMENLPVEYARIFAFSDFRQSQKRAIAQLQKNPLQIGTHVRIHLRMTSGSAEDLRRLQQSLPLVACALRRHEQKMSVVHCKVYRAPSSADDAAVNSKEPLLFQCGFRSFMVHPLFSEINSRADKNKFERFLYPKQHVCASAFMPITFPGAPVLVFRPPTQAPLSQPGDLVATGAVMAVDPSRIILKRIVLSGYPFRVHKRTAVIRYMFYNPDDVRWFKPVEIRTKNGLRGHIKEPLGTHGYMKIRLDNPMKGDDTVLMNLYKRVYPKWNTREVTIFGERDVSQGSS